MSIPKEQIRQIITENNFHNVADVYAYLKEGFKDILQELMESELDATLGYEKYQKRVLPIKETDIPPFTNFLFE